MMNVKTYIFFYFFIQSSIKAQPEQVNFYRNPSHFYNNYPYYVPPLQTYNVCPDLFYFYDYEPILSGEDARLTASRQLLNNNKKYEKFSRLFNLNLNNSNLLNIFKKNVSQFQPQIQINQNRPWMLTPGQVQSQPQGPFSQASGPFYNIISKTYEKCCPLNRNRLNGVKLKDDAQLYDYLFESFTNQTHILHYQSQGMFGVIEFYNQQSGSSYNPFYVQIMNSDGFYLISKRERNGAPTITPIALTILLNAWPLLVFILLANAFAGVFIWFLDRALKQYQFPKQFVKGTGYGMWWSYFLFTATSLAPRIDFRGWLIRIFTVIWMMVCLVMVVIFIAMFTTQLTIYALNGQSLVQKLVAINKYSTDRIWLENEDAISVEYDNMIDMFRDLDDQKVEFVLVDKIYANFYSQIVNEKFYIMRQVNRKKSYNILLRGFNSEQLTCFQSTSQIFFIQWLRQNLTSNSYKLKDTSDYFNITDELLYPRRNAILLLAIGVLVMIIIIGISWEITCMKQTGLSSIGGLAGFAGNRLLNGGRGGGGGGGGALNRFMRNGSRRNRRDADNESNGVGSFIEDGIEAATRNSGTGGGIGHSGSNSNNNININSSGGGGGTGTGGGGGGLANIGRSLFNGNNPIGGLVENISSVRNILPGFLSPNTEYLDRSVKFNPLVHNFYYSKSPSSTDVYDKALINARDQAVLNKSYTSDTDSEKFIIGSKNWNYFKINDPPLFEEIVKESSTPYKSVYSNDYQMQKDTSNLISSTTTPSSTSSYNLSQVHVGTNSNPSVNRTNITRVDLSNNSEPNHRQYSIKRQINYRPSNSSSKDGIVLNQPLTNAINQESNTDENVEYNTIPASLKNEIEKRNLSNKLSASNAQLNTVYSNVQMPSHHKELARNESFYLTEYSSVKL